jgi:DNA-binding MarR family transcriptional regulator
MLAHSSGLSQRELAAKLHMHASRLVAVVDEMESLGLVVRSANSEDRRSYALELTPAGREKLTEVGKVAREHNEALCSALSVEEREILAGLLQRIADAQGLTRGVHPGYRRLGEDSPSGRTSSARDRSGTVVRE